MKLSCWMVDVRTGDFRLPPQPELRLNPHPLLALHARCPRCPCRSNLLINVNPHRVVILTSLFNCLPGNAASLLEGKLLWLLERLAGQQPPKESFAELTGALTNPVACAFPLLAQACYLSHALSLGYACCPKHPITGTLTPALYAACLPAGRSCSGYWSGSCPSCPQTSPCMCWVLPTLKACHSWPPMAATHLIPATPQGQGGTARCSRRRGRCGW